MMIKRSARMAVLPVFAMLLACALGPSDAIAAQRIYDGISGAELQRLLQNLGYRASLEERSSGDPVITTSMEGLRVKIYTYNCRQGSCNNIRFSVGLDLTDGATLEKANEFNQSFIFGNVVLDDRKDPWLRMTHNVADGVTPKNIEYTINRFAQAIETFTDHFDFRR